ncbi:MAG TPA: AraC family transcriptional regulator [Lachnospiraceae bacterium]|nr:AraC family transcriptional regulator [Lachnospiraceae bacterium]
MKQIEELYNPVFKKCGFILKPQTKTEDHSICYELRPDKGQGSYRIYYYQDMFEISFKNFFFYEDYFMECPEVEFLSVDYYSSVSGEEFHPYYQLSPDSLRVHIGEKNKLFQAIYHKNVPIRSVGISMMPNFYSQYLRKKFSYDDFIPSEAFRQFQSGTDFPQLAALLKQIEHYRGTGLAAKMFYEGKVLEAIALIIEKAKLIQKNRTKISLTETDSEGLMNVVTYIDNHYAFQIPLERLCRISFMGSTKLKAAFKSLMGCTISEYILQKKIGHAQHLLIGTDLTIAEIAKAVGYKRPDSFAKQFQKATGLLPREYRGLTTGPII